MLAYRMIAALAAIPAILLPLAASAQTPASGSAAAPPLVTVNGQRLVSADPTQFLAARNPVLNSAYASSCSFMAPYSPYNDEVYLEYMQHFYPEGSISGALTVREYSPFGDATSASNTIGVPRFDAASSAQSGGLTRVLGACGNADFAFAAGRHAIRRQDKTLTQAIAAYQAGNYAGAMASFKANYDKLGSEIAALMVADMYRQGIGVAADPAQAVTWLDKIIEARYSPSARMRFDPKDPSNMSVRAEAAMTLAGMYRTGQGVARDPAAARKYYQLAADAGYVPAESLLAQGYLAGLAGEKSVDKAVQYLKSAGQAGYAPALYQLGQLYYSGADQLPQDLQLAGAYFAAAAKLGDARAEYAAALMYDQGVGVAVDQRRAIVLYKEAAVKGYAAAKAALATYFYTGEVVDQNLATARGLFKEAAMQGQPDAMFNLGVMTGNGEGGPQDLAMAYVWYRLALASGKENAAVAAQEVSLKLSSDQRKKADAILAPVPRG